MCQARPMCPHAATSPGRTWVTGKVGHFPRATEPFDSSGTDRTQAF